MLRLGSRVAQAASKLVLALVGLVLGLVLMIFIASGALVWWLTEGPWDATAVAKRIEANIAPGVTTGGVVLSMARSGGVHLLRLDITDLQSTSGPDELVSVRSAAISLPFRKLLRGALEPTEIIADGVRLRMKRAASKRAGGGFNLRDFDSLQHVSVTDVQASVFDENMQVRWALTNLAADAHRQVDGTVAAEVDASGTVGAVPAHLLLKGTHGPGGAHADLTISAISPASLARAIPALSSLSMVDAPIAAQAAVDFGPDMSVTHAAIHAESGPGTVMLPANTGPPAPAHFAAMALDAEGSPEAITLRSLHLVLAPQSANPASNIVITGSARRHGGRMRAQLQVDLDQANAADLGALWPERLGGGTRPWLVENVPAGVAHDGHFSFTLEGGGNGENITLTSATGSITADEATVFWLKPVPPLDHAHVLASFVDPDTMLITVSAARTGAITLRNGTMRIKGLSVKDQTAVLNADLAGPLADVLTLLAHPRLHLLSQRPLPATNPSGSVAAHLSVSLPLDDKVDIDQVAIHGAGKVSDVHLGQIALGRDMDRGQFAIDVTNDGLKSSGPCLLDQLPSKVQVDMDFRDGPPSQVIQHVAVTTQVTPPSAKAAGLSVMGLDTGQMAAAIDYIERRDGTASVKVDADLKDAAFDTPIGWSKAAGEAGHAEGRALLDHGRLVGLEGIKANGPGLSIVARSEMVDGRPAVVHILHGDIGRSSATGTIGLPQREGDPYRVTLTGPRLDLEGRLRDQDSGNSAAGSAPEAKGAPYAIDLRFERVTFGANHVIGPVAVTATGTGRRLTSAKLSSTGRERVQAELTPGAGERRLRATIGNLGVLLRETDVAKEIDGGSFEVVAAYDDRVSGSPLSGVMDLSDFRVRGAPVIGKILQAMTFYGLVDALSGPGLAFDRMVAPFQIENSVVTLKEMRAFSSSLGVTGTGRLDFGSQTIDLTGTVVPAYMINALPGRVPFLGRLFSPEKGGGIFAATYGLHGKLTDPTVAYNPLSALTPGFLRGVFDLFK